MREPVLDEALEGPIGGRDDIQVAARAISDCHTRQMERSLAKLLLEMRDANLEEAVLTHLNLSNARLWRANLRRARLDLAKLTDASLAHARLNDADLRYATLTGADLAGANIGGTSLTGTRGLTQAQFDSAWSLPDHPPTLDGVLDAENGAQLVWRCKPLEDRA